MRKIIQSHRHHHLRLTVRRSHIFEDSFFAIRAHPPNDLKGPLNIRFEGEAGIDAGGLTREFFLSLSKEMFNPNYALFIQSFEHATFQPNPLSGINADHLDYFRFVGRVIAMALLHDQLLDAYFTRSFYKHILGVPIEIRDVESIDPEYYKSLQWMLDNPIEGVLDLNFTVEVEEFGLKKIVDLVENGSQIAVTDDNKKEYVRLVANAKMTSSIEKQIEAFNNGFREVIPIEKFSMFDEHELELLLNGMPEIDVDDLRKNTIYQGYGAGDTQVVWFWKVVQEMDKEDKARLVQFVTGTSKVPLGGFAELTGMSGPQKFSIHRVRGRGRALPTAHTCFNQLDLPEYESEEVLRDMLTLAIREGNQYFGAV
jgi:E3 ubiquitin-protein ligase HUWE1